MQLPEKSRDKIALLFLRLNKEDIFPLNPLIKYETAIKGLTENDTMICFLYAIIVEGDHSGIWVRALRTQTKDQDNIYFLRESLIISVQVLMKQSAQEAHKIGFVPQGCNITDLTS